MLFRKYILLWKILSTELPWVGHGIMSQGVGQWHSYRWHGNVQNMFITSCSRSWWDACQEMFTPVSCCISFHSRMGQCILPVVLAGRIFNDLIKGNRKVVTILSAGQYVFERDGVFYHDVDEISDLSQSETLNLVIWRVRVMEPTTPSPWKRGRSWRQYDVQEIGSMKHHYKIYCRTRLTENQL